MPALGRLQVNRAREGQQCKECDAEILAGELYLSLSGHVGNRWLNTKLHFPCLLHLARRRYAQRDLASLPEDKKALRRKLVQARSYALRTGNQDRLKEVQQALTSFGVEAPYRSTSKARRDAMYEGTTVKETIAASKDRSIRRMPTTRLLSMLHYKVEAGTEAPEGDALARIAKGVIEDRLISASILGKPLDVDALEELARRTNLVDFLHGVAPKPCPESGVEQPSEEMGVTCSDCMTLLDNPNHLAKHKAWEKKRDKEFTSALDNIERAKAAGLYKDDVIEGQEE